MNEIKKSPRLAENPADLWKAFYQKSREDWRVFAVVPLVGRFQIGTKDGSTKTEIRHCYETSSGVPVFETASKSQLSEMDWAFAHDTVNIEILERALGGGVRNKVILHQAHGRWSQEQGS